MPGQANMLQSLGWAILNSFWQMGFLWLIYLVFSGVLKSARSPFRSTLASSLLITGFGWFIFTFISYSKSLSPGYSLIPASLLNTEELQTGLLISLLHKLLSATSLIYLALLLWPIAHFFRNYRYVQVIRQSGLSKADVKWRIFVKELATRMGIIKPVQLWVSEFVSSPVTIGFLKPVILVPLAAINHLSAQQMEAVLLHELSHIRRYDYLINLVINFINTILYFNPFVKVLMKAVEREREKSCDEMVLQFQYNSYEYAKALLTLERTYHDNRLFAVGASGNKNDLLQRVELIMGIRSKPVFSVKRITRLIAVFVSLIAFNAMLYFGKQPGMKMKGIVSGSRTSIQKPLVAAMETSAKPVAKEREYSLVNNRTGKKAIQDKLTELSNKPALIPVTGGYIPAAFGSFMNRPLKESEEIQVITAIASSKKVLETEQWKKMEISIAEVFTQKEKMEIKAILRKELENLDWNKWENRLRLSFDSVDWNRVNEQLARAVNNIRLDSIELVCSEAIGKLDRIRLDLTTNHFDGIPDSGITLKTIEEKKQLVLKILDSLKLARSRKIVHL